MHQSLAEVARGWRERGASAIRVRIRTAEGSTPRDADAVMLVAEDGVAGTIGGGRLEWDAIARARAMIRSGERRSGLTVLLGPEIGQCCGGRVTLALDAITDDIAADLARREADEASGRKPVLIYGAGHVGRALARALAPLPFRVMLIDGRREELDRADAPGASLRLEPAPAALAEAAPADAAHVVMTHSHSLDSLIAAAVLERGAFAYLGLIGSATKRASFLGAFRKLGLPDERIARVVCPIGGSAVRDKRPAVIAALAAAEIATALLSAPAE